MELGQGRGLVEEVEGVGGHHRIERVVGERQLLRSRQQPGDRVGASPGMRQHPLRCVAAVDDLDRELGPDPGGQDPGAAADVGDSPGPAPAQLGDDLVLRRPVHNRLDQGGVVDAGQPVEQAGDCRGAIASVAIGSVESAQGGHGSTQPGIRSCPSRIVGCAG